MFKEQLRLLAQLVESDKKLVDAAGIPVSPRTELEIKVWPLALQLRKQMLEVESTKWFPQVRKPYRELKEQLEVYCSEVFLSDFLNTVLTKLETGEYQIQELP